MRLLGSLVAFVIVLAGVTGSEAQMYRWTDEQGVEHWTDRPETVPQQYRAPAKRAQPS